MTEQDRELFRVQAIARIAATLLAGDMAGHCIPIGRTKASYVEDAVLLWNESAIQAPHPDERIVV